MDKTVRYERDGHVVFIKQTISPQVLRAICTPNGSESLTIDN